MRNSEKGQALPLALLVLAVGTLVIAPFLGHASSNLIGSRIYGQAISEQYSCDAGVEWALWRLKGNPVLTTDTTYHTTSLELIPNGINGSSFPTTELRFIEDAGATETIVPEWLTGPGWMHYPFRATDEGIVLVIVECDAPIVKIKLHGAAGPPGSSPYTAEIGPVSPDQPDQEIWVQTLDIAYNEKGKPIEIPYYGPGTIIITYPIASYDIRAQKGDRTITVRTTASYLATRVISWQVE